MIYGLPEYPTTALEMLVNLTNFVTKTNPTIDKEQTTHIQGLLVPVAHLAHTGTMIVPTLSQVSHTHIQFVYDASAGYPILPASQGSLKTRFGKTISLTYGTIVPQCVEELCCMIQLYTKITSIAIYEKNEIMHMPSDVFTIWLGGRMHADISLEDSVTIDEQVLGEFAKGVLTDTSLVDFDCMNEMVEYYIARPKTYMFVPVSYHNSAMLDGQKDSTTSYCTIAIYER